MNIIEIIDKKRLGNELTYDELNYAFLGYLNKRHEDYQMSSLLMAILINGMTKEETINLTDIFIKSGDIYDLSKVSDKIVDKHSTGGIGDTTTLVVGPIVAALGCYMAKISGRGLGITGGTIDKLESIPKFNVNLNKKEFINNLRNVGFVDCSQTKRLVPLDKIIYNLRNNSGTTESIPLIASSIMSKKIASGVGEYSINHTDNDKCQIVFNYDGKGSNIDEWVELLTKWNDSGKPLEVVYNLNTPSTLDITDNINFSTLNNLFGKYNTMNINTSISPSNITYQSLL